MAPPPEPHIEKHYAAANAPMLHRLRQVRGTRRHARATDTPGVGVGTA